MKKTVFDFSLLFPKKNGLRRKSKVCPLDTVTGIKDIVATKGIRPNE